MFSSLFTGKLSSSNNHLENSDDTGASRNKDDSMNDSIHDETLLYDKTDDACKENDVPPSFNENHIVEYSDNDDASNKKPRHTDAVIMAMDAYMDGFDNGNSTYEVGMNQSQCPVLENNEENVPQLSSTNDAYETMTIHNDPEKSMSTENEIYVRTKAAW